MIPGRSAAGTVTAVAASLALAVAGCGQVGVGEQTPGTADPAVPATAATAAATATSPPDAADPTAVTPPPSPGPEATPGCETLTEPVHRLVHGTDLVHDTDDRAATSAEVRRLADGVTDNALSAVASRLSGIAVQPTVSPAALESQWDQFRRLCDLP